MTTLEPSALGKKLKMIIDRGAKFTKELEDLHQIFDKQFNLTENAKIYDSYMEDIYNTYYNLKIEIASFEASFGEKLDMLNNLKKVEGERKFLEEQRKKREAELREQVETEIRKSRLNSANNSKHNSASNSAHNSIHNSAHSSLHNSGQNTPYRPASPHFNTRVEYQNYTYGGGEPEPSIVQPIRQVELIHQGYTRADIDKCMQHFSEADIQKTMQLMTLMRLKENIENNGVNL